MTAKIFSGKLNAAILRVLLITFLFYGCSQDEPQNFETCFDNIQNQDENGVDCGGICPFKCPASMSAKVNGNSWIADTTIQVGYNPSVPSLTITASIPGSFHPRMQLFYVGSLSPGEHDLNSSTSYVTSLSAFVVFDSGKINFTDTRDGLLNGTFHFICADTSAGVTYNITDGIFENLPY